MLDQDHDQTDDTARERGPAVTISAPGQLLAVIQRVERLEAEKAEIGEQIKEVLGEAKGGGFDVKTIRRIIALRKKKPEERSEEEAMLDLYMTALEQAR